MQRLFLTHSDYNQWQVTSSGINFSQLEKAVAVSASPRVVTSLGPDFSVFLLFIIVFLAGGIAFHEHIYFVGRLS